MDAIEDLKRWTGFEEGRTTISTRERERQLSTQVAISRASAFSTHSRIGGSPFGP